MERLERVTPLESILNPQIQEDIFSTITQLINQNQLTSEIYTKFKNHFVGRGESVETYVQDGIDAGILKWQREKLVKDISRFNITLTEEEEDALRQKSLETDLSPERIIRSVLHEFLLIDISINERG